MDFEKIYRLYFKDVFLYVCSLSSDGHMAEEITQQAFVKALQAISSFDGRKDIRAWLFTIAKNTYFTHCRRNNILPQEGLSETASSSDTPLAERLADEESAFLLHQYLHTMEEPYKEVFSLRVFGELPFEKIARLFGKSPGWARVTYHRAKKKILENMEVLEHERNKL